MIKKLLSFMSVASAVLLMGAAPASAEILFAGGEIHDFNCSAPSACNSTTSSTYYITGYARLALNPEKGSFLQTPTFTPQSTLWFHTTMARGFSTGTTSDYNIIVLRSPDGVARLAIRGTGTNSTVKISKANSVGTYTDLVTNIGGWNTITHRIDLFVNYSTTGQVSLYMDGVQIADYTGDVTTDSATQINRIDIGNANNSGTAGYEDWWSEVVVSTTDTRAMRLVTVPLAANGATVDWTIGGVANVNEATLSDATLNASDTAGQVQLYTLSAMPAGSFNIVDVWQTMRARVDTTGPQNMRAAIRTGGTNYMSTDLSPPQTVWGTVRKNWATNPATGVAWTLNDLSTLQSGFESRN